MKTILISGYYGFNNIGDEAVLGGMLAGFRTMLPDVHPVVLSANPEFSRQLHGVEAIPRMQVGAIRAALRGADLFISGGGSLLQDVTSVKSPLYYLGLLWLARRAGVPAMMFAQGVGPLSHPVNRLLARRELNRLRAITVRDAASAELLRRLGVSRPPVRVTADPSFLLQPDYSERLESWWTAHVPADRPVIGVALRPWRQGETAERYTAIADACRKIGRSVKSVAVVATAAVKKDEIGLLAMVQQMAVPMEAYSGEQLQQCIDQHRLETSEFVEEQIGVGNVCEAAALLAAGTDKLLLGKTVYDRITVAIAEVESRS
jgi:polysaccharide pyruvyl transferase CsaB